FIDGFLASPSLPLSLSLSVSLESSPLASFFSSPSLWATTVSAGGLGLVLPLPFFLFDFGFGFCSGGLSGLGAASALGSSGFAGSTAGAAAWSSCFTRGADTSLLWMGTTNSGALALDRLVWTSIAARNSKTTGAAEPQSISLTFFDRGAAGVSRR